MPRPPLLAAAFLLTAAALSAADWPGWRGPNRTGVSPEGGLLQSWPPGGPRRVWVADALGSGFSSVAVAGGTVYGTGLKDGREFAWALNESDGKVKWAVPFAGDGEPGGPSRGPNSTPTFAGSRLFAVSSGGDLVCLEAAAGKIVWERNYKRFLDGRMMSGWGWSESVLVDGDRVICTPGADAAAVAALRTDNGAVVWKTEVPKAGGAGYSSPVKAVIGDVPIYVTMLGGDRGHTTGGVVGVNADTGKLLWRYTKVTNGTANIPTVIVRDGRVWCSTGYGDGGAALLRLTPDGPDKMYMKELRHYSAGELQNHHGGAVLVGDHVYFGAVHNQGYPACVEFKTGKLAWGPVKPPPGCTGSAAVVGTYRMLYFRYQNGRVAMLRADPSRYDVVSTFDIPDRDPKVPSWSHPVVANRRLYLREQDKLHCYDITGQPSWLDID